MAVDQVACNRESALKKCQELFDHFNVRAKKHKKTFNRFKYLSVALTVGVTVISALEAIETSLIWRWSLPVASGLAAFCTSMVHVTNAHELWVRARAMTHRLTAERFLFEQGAGIYAEAPQKATEVFSTRLMDIWASGHEEWEKAVEHQQST
jgi:hypothetical protein